MDNLSRCMVQCKADGYGCHYGAWRAAQGDVVIVKDNGIPEGFKKCEWCGDLFKPAKRSDQRYCGAYCQALASRERCKKNKK